MSSCVGNFFLHLKLLPRKDWKTKIGSYVKSTPSTKTCIFNRPIVAGAILQTVLLLINRPGVAMAILQHICHLLIKSLSHRLILCENIFKTPLLPNRKS